MSYTECFYSSADGLKLYYRRYGSAPNVLLCLPGLTRNCKDFEKLAAHLAASWQVITPDLRGRGLSQWDSNPGNYHPGTYVRDIWALLDQLAVGRATVIGTSLGGLVAMAMAAQQPARLRGIVLNDIGPEIPPAALARILRYAGRAPPADSWQDAAEQARAIYGLAYPDMPEDFWSQYVRLSWREDAAGRPVPDLDPAVGNVLREPPVMLKALQWLGRHGLIHRLRGVPIDPWEAFLAINMPCLLLHGEISDVLTDEVVRHMQQAKPAMDVITVPQRGHVPLLDEPVALDGIERFLDSLPP